MGIVLDSERLTSISNVTPLRYRTDFGAGLTAEDAAPNTLQVTIRPVGGDIHLGMGGKTASSTVGFLIKDGEVWEYDDDITKLNILGLTTGITLYLLHEKG